MRNCVGDWSHIEVHTVDIGLTTDLRSGTRLTKETRNPGRSSGPLGMISPFNLNNQSLQCHTHHMLHVIYRYASDPQHLSCQVPRGIIASEVLKIHFRSTGRTRAYTGPKSNVIFSNYRRGTCGWLSLGAIMNRSPKLTV